MWIQHILREENKKLHVKTSVVSSHIDMHIRFKKRIHIHTYVVWKFHLLDHIRFLDVLYVQHEFHMLFL